MYVLYLKHTTPPLPHTHAFTFLLTYPAVGIVAVSCGENYSANERVDLSSKLLLSHHLILVWSFSDPIHPVVRTCTYVCTVTYVHASVCVRACVLVCMCVCVCVCVYLSLYGCRSRQVTVTMQAQSPPPPAPLSRTCSFSWKPRTTSSALSSIPTNHTL